MTILNTLAPWALTSSLLILAVLLLRLLLREDLSARARYALWAVVLVRLLIPFQLSAPNLSLPDAAGLAPTFSDPLEDFQDTGIYAFPTGEVNPDLASSSGTDIVSYGITSRQILGLPVQYIDGCDVATEEGLVPTPCICPCPICCSCCGPPGPWRWGPRCWCPTCASPAGCGWMSRCTSVFP